jgi:acyl carrier protein
METKNFEVNELPVVSKSESTDEKVGSQQTSTKAVQIQSRLVDYIAELLEINPNQIDPTISFQRYGLDSSAIAGMSGDLENWLGVEISPSLIYQFPTINTLAQHLAIKQAQD